MSPSGQLLARAYAVTHPPGTSQLPTAAGWTQLIHTRGGVLDVAVASTRWVVHPGRGIWVPAPGVATVRTRTRARVRVVYLDQGLTPGGPVRVVRMSRLASELVEHIGRVAPIHAGTPAGEAAITLLQAEVERLDDDGMRLRWPTSPVALAAANRLAEDPTTDAGAVASGLPTSRRSLDRAFVAETGMPVATWHRLHRMLDAIHLLDEGATVAGVARVAGFSSPSAFIAAFRRTFGVTPGSVGRDEAGVGRIPDSGDGRA